MGGRQVDTIYMDLAKAFDRVDHSTLLSKLATMPIHVRLIKLLHSYLTNRTQIVCVGGEKSNPINPLSSVPQGSILSPLLFALFINDLAILIRSKILIFADDVKIFLRIDTLEDARKLQNDINTTLDWCNNNKLNINVNKCFIMSFTHRREITFQYFNYNINGRTLNRVNSMRDLGVTFDPKLSFSQHITNLTKKAHKMLGFITRSLNRFKNLATYRLLYYTYVRSALEYCSPVWNPIYNNSINILERIQRRFTRTIYRKFHYPHELSYIMRNIRLDMLSLEDRRMVTDEIVLYKIVTGRMRTELLASLHFNQPIRFTRQTVNAPNTFYLPFVTSNLEYHSPILRIQRQHDRIFSNIDLDENRLNSVKRSGNVNKR